MVDLQQYEEYFRELSQALPGIGSMIPVTYDIDIYEYVQSLRAEDLPVLFVVLPTCESLSRDPDCVVERNFGMCLLLDKTDWQRERGLDAQKRLQPTFEEIKSMMRQEYGRCGIFFTTEPGGDDVLSRVRTVQGAVRMESGIYV